MNDQPKPWITPAVFVDRDELRRQYCTACKGSGVMLVEQEGCFTGGYDDSGNPVGHYEIFEMPCIECAPRSTSDSHGGKDG